MKIRWIRYTDQNGQTTEPCLQYFTGNPGKWVTVPTVEEEIEVDYPGKSKNLTLELIKKGIL